MHQPVLKKEILEYFEPSSGKNFVDCTFGFGGHSLSILEKNKPDGKVLGIEIDKEVFDLWTSDIDRLILIRGSYVDLEEIVEENDFGLVDGILLDLGFSSWQIEESGRGFSFLKDEPLIMRFGPEGITAEEIVNSWPEQELYKILKEYGEERYAGRIAKSIYQNRRKERIKRAGQLVEIIRKAVPISYQRKKINFATKTFQALRIAVNEELSNLEKVLPQTLKILNKRGRLVVISFHSLEDRIVKNFFRQKVKEGEIEILTKKPIGPDLEEIRLNPRSRSAKLRAILKL